MSDCSFKISIISIIIHNIFCLHGDKMFIWFLTRTWSSSLLVCISCFSSSTIFSMASFSTSSRRSDICGQRQTGPSQYDSRLLVVLLVCLYQSNSVYRSYRCHALLQLLNSFQSSSFGLGVLQQRPDIEHIVEVCLNLNLQPVALCVLQPLRWDSQTDKLTAIHWSQCWWSDPPHMEKTLNPQFLQMVRWALHVASDRSNFPFRLRVGVTIFQIHNSIWF